MVILPELSISKNSNAAASSSSVTSTPPFSFLGTELRSYLSPFLIDCSGRRFVSFVLESAIAAHTVHRYLSALPPCMLQDVKM